MMVVKICVVKKGLSWTNLQSLWKYQEFEVHDQSFSVLFSPSGTLPKKILSYHVIIEPVLSRVAFICSQFIFVVLTIVSSVNFGQK